MKRIFLLITIIIVVAQLTAQHGGGDFEKLLNFQKDPSFDNLYAALQYYQDLLNSEDREMAHIALANLHMIAMDNIIEDMQSNLDSLTLRSQFQLANLLLENKRFKESIRIYDVINSTSPNWSCPWRHKGEALFRLSKYNEAETATIKAIETREDHYDAYIQLAEIQMNLEKFTEALETLDKASEYVSSDHENEVAPGKVADLKAKLEALINNN